MVDFGTSYYAWDMWIRFTTINSLNMIFDQFGSTTNLMSFYYNGAYFRLSHTVGNVTMAVANWTDSISTDTWYHLALVRDGSGMRLFRDGGLLTPWSVVSAVGKDIGVLPDAFTLMSRVGDYVVAGQMDELSLSIGTDRISVSTDALYCGGTPANGFTPPAGPYALA